MSVLRIVLSAALLFVSDNRTLFLGIFAFAGLTDIADGFIARKYHLETTVGAKLDSFADFIYLAASLFCMFFSYQLFIPTNVLVFCGIIAIIRIGNFIITRVKFRQWGILHTIGNKVTGLSIFFICPIAILTGRLPFMIIILPLLAALEETVLLSISSSYNPNAKSVLHKSNKLEVTYHG